MICLLLLGSDSSLSTVCFLGSALHKSPGKVLWALDSGVVLLQFWAYALPLGLSCTGTAGEQYQDLCGPPHTQKGDSVFQLPFLGFSPCSLSSSSQFLWPDRLGFHWHFNCLCHPHSYSPKTRACPQSKARGEKRDENNGVYFPRPSG